MIGHMIRLSNLNASVNDFDATYNIKLTNFTSKQYGGIDAVFILLFIDLYYKMENNKYCEFPEDEDGIQMYYQDVTRYDDLGNITRACTAQQLAHQTCTQFYFSDFAKAYFICPPGSTFRELNGYRVYYSEISEEE